MKNNNVVDHAVVAAWITAEALLTLLVGTIALVMLVAELPTRAPAPAPATPPIAPALHPIAALAEPVLANLEPCTVSTLRRQARAAGLPRSLTRSGTRTALLQALAGWEVAVT